jgi:hypothetical protein
MLFGMSRNSRGYIEGDVTPPGQAAESAKVEYRSTRSRHGVHERSEITLALVRLYPWFDSWFVRERMIAEQTVGLGEVFCNTPRGRLNLALSVAQ